VTSGLGLEAGLADALAAAADEGVPVLELGPGLDPQPLGGTDSATPDPHWWLDPRRVARAVELIADRLTQVGEGDWTARATAFASELASLDVELGTSLATIPVERRKLDEQDDEDQCERGRGADPG
jgi:zinc/manganese transport system substrate-binding protein